MKSIVRRIALAVIAVAALIIIIFLAVYSSRFKTIGSIEKLTDYDEYNVYKMDVKYDYSLDDVCLLYTSGASSQISDMMNAA